MGRGERYVKRPPEKGEKERGLRCPDRAVSFSADELKKHEAFI